MTAEATLVRLSLHDAQQAGLQASQGTTRWSEIRINSIFAEWFAIVTCILAEVDMVGNKEEAVSWSIHKECGLAPGE